VHKYGSFQKIAFVNLPQKYEKFHSDTLVLFFSPESKRSGEQKDWAFGIYCHLQRCSHL
jgi:hypothetical protein